MISRLEYIRERLAYKKAAITLIYFLFHLIHSQNAQLTSCFLDVMSRSTQGTLFYDFGMPKNTGLNIRRNNDN